MSSGVLFFLLGLALGGSAAWFIVRPPSAPAKAPAPAARAAPVTFPAWSWRDSATPATLAPDLAASAITAWRSLRAPDGSAADFATRADTLHALLVRLPAEALPRLLAALAPDASPAGLRLLDIGFDAWVEVDPAAATRWASSAGPDFKDLAVRAIRAWSALDAEAAATWACALPSPTLAPYLAHRALSVLAEKNPARALALANSRDDAFRESVFGSMIEPLSKADPAAAVQAYSPLIWNNGKGYSTLRQTIQAWALRDPAAAIGWLSAQPCQTSMLSYHLADLAQSSQDRAAIATAVATAPGIPDRQGILVRIVSDWENEQPAEALAWLKGLNDPDLSAQLLLGALNRSTPGNPQASLTLALPEGAIRTEKLGQTLAEWAEKDSSAALAWIREHDQPGVAAAAASAQGAILGTIARDEPATALAEWSRIADPQTRAAALLPITQAWGRTDPAAALTWYAEQKPAAAGQGYFALSKLIYTWSKKDPAAALGWAEAFALSHPPQTNTALGGMTGVAYLYALAGEWDERAPRATTAELFSKVVDPALRTEALTILLRDWLNTDPVAAKTWLDSHPVLTPAQTAALLAP